MRARVGRRAFLRVALAVGAVAGWPGRLRAQPKAVRIGAIHPFTGPFAEIGQACRLGAQMAADAVNAAGGIKSLGGARLELVPGDTEGKSEVARAEAERVIGAGAQVLTGAFHSGQTAAIASVAQGKRVPFLIDIAVADAITLNVAASVKRGVEPVQYVYRNFPTATTSGRKAVQYMKDIFKDARVSPKRVVLIYTNDVFGQMQAKQFQALVKEMSPGFSLVEPLLPYPENATELSREVSKAKSLKPDVVALVTRAATAVPLLFELARQRVDVMGVVSPGTPGLYEPGQLAQLKELVEHVMDNVPWPNMRNVRTQKVAEEYAKRTGKALDSNAGYAYEAIVVIADVLERAASTEGEVVVDAIKKTDLKEPLMVAAGPVTFNEVGDNPNAATAMIQILGQKPAVVWPREAATAKYVFPRPRAKR